MTSTRFGFVGLGAMGAPMAANIAKAGFNLTVYDKAGTRERAPTGTSVAACLAELASVAETIFLSVPDGHASLAVAKQITTPTDRVTQVVIDLSTTGIEAAQKVHQHFTEADIIFIDSPVSGGQAGARAGTITAIWAGPKTILEGHRPVLEAISKNIFHVGDRPGQGQAVKLLNNFLSATALAATSEAMLFGLSQGLDLKTVLDVVNVSTGRNTATSDKFPNRILTGSFDAGFRTALMAKDVELYFNSVTAAQTPGAIGEAVRKLWRHADEAMPHSDITQIYQLLSGADTPPEPSG